MAKSQDPGVEVNPNVIARLIDQVQQNSDKLVKNMNANMVRLIKQIDKDSLQDKDAEELKIKVGYLERKIDSVPSIGIAYKTPTYRRVLRRGEGIDDIALRGPLNPLVKAAGNKFAEKYEEKFKLENGGKLPGEKLKAIEGASAAMRAVTAAFIDRSGLDQTTRYLLTRKNLLAGQLYRVHEEGSPALHETIAVMEAINRSLVGLVHDDASEGFYDLLVNKYGEKRGWTDETTKKVATLLAKRYEKRG